MDNFCLFNFPRTAVKLITPPGPEWSRFEFGNTGSTPPQSKASIKAGYSQKTWTYVEWVAVLINLHGVGVGQVEDLLLRSRVGWGGCHEQTEDRVELVHFEDGCGVHRYFSMAVKLTSVYQLTEVETSIELHLYTHLPTKVLWNIFCMHSEQHFSSLKAFHCFHGMENISV